MEFDEKSVVPVLEAKYDSFTQSEKNIADFFLKNKNQEITQSRHYHKNYLCRKPQYQGL